MPLRKDVQQLHALCDDMIRLMREQPDLLTGRERLEIETAITRLMTAIVETESLRRKDGGSGP